MRREYVKIVVLVKQVPDTYGDRKLNTSTGWLDRGTGDAVIDEINERALEVALRYKDANKGTEVVVLSMGPAPTVDALRKALTMGADSAVHVLDDQLAGSDAGWTSEVLAAALKTTGFDLVVGGNESTDGSGGVIPAMIAERLSLPHLTFLDSVELSEGSVSAVRRTDIGTVTMHASLPAVISISESLPEARFPSFKGIMSAKKKPFTVLSLGDLGLNPATSSASVGHTVIVSTVERPARTAGKKIVDEGNAGIELAEFLVAGRLI